MYLILFNYIVRNTLIHRDNFMDWDPNMKFLVIFLLIPLLELYVLIEVGSQIGAFTTILLIVGTAILGATLMRNQGLMTMQKAQQALANGGVAPQQEMIEGVMIFMGGLFLLLPGFMTDTLGLLFLIPPLRRRLAKQFLQYRQTRSRYYHQQHQNTYEGEWHTQSGHGELKRLKQDDIIEGEIIEEKPPKK